MKIFVIGGTGLVGSYLLSGLVSDGNEVYVLTRNWTLAKSVLTT